MNAGAQIWHVVKKDVSCYRWLWLAIAVGTAIVGLTPDAKWPYDGSRELTIFACWALLVGAITLTVHLDSPWRTPSAWRALPLNPLAVLAAKLLVMVLALGWFVAWHGVQLRAFGLDRDDLWYTLGCSALISSGVLMIPFIAATVSEGLGMTALMLIATLIASTYVGTIVSRLFDQDLTPKLAGDPGFTFGLPFNLVFAFTGLALLYTGGVRRAWALTLMTVWFATLIAPPLHLGMGNEGPNASVDLVTARLAGVHTSAEGTQFTVYVSPRSAAPNERTVMSWTTLHLRQENGTERQVPLGTVTVEERRRVSERSRIIGEPTVIPSLSVPWPASESTPRGDRGSAEITTFVSNDAVLSDALHSDRTTWWLTGTVTTLTAQSPLWMRPRNFDSTSAPGIVVGQRYSHPLVYSAFTMVRRAFRLPYDEQWMSSPTFVYGDSARQSFVAMRHASIGAPRYMLLGGAEVVVSDVPESLAPSADDSTARARLGEGRGIIGLVAWRLRSSRPFRTTPQRLITRTAEGQR